MLEFNNYEEFRGTICKLGKHSWKQKIRIGNVVWNNAIECMADFED